MTMKERRNWEINIENVAAEVATKAGSAVVRSIFQRYDAKGLHDLSLSFTVKFLLISSKSEMINLFFFLFWVSRG